MKRKTPHRGPGPVKLTLTEIKAKLRMLPGWQYNAKKRAIYAEFKLKNFMEAVKMINRIAKLAEKMNHHPDLHLTNYKKLTVVLTTHDAGGVSERDFKFVSTRTLSGAEVLVG